MEIRTWLDSVEKGYMVWWVQLDPVPVCIMVRIAVGKGMLPSCLVLTIQPELYLQACIRQSYEFTDEKVFPLMDFFFSDCTVIFHDDDARIHQAQSVKVCFIEHETCFSHLHWTPWSPDLKPAEHFWYVLKQGCHYCWQTGENIDRQRKCSHVVYDMVNSRRIIKKIIINKLWPQFIGALEYFREAEAPKFWLAMSMCWRMYQVYAIIITWHRLIDRKCALLSMVALARQCKRFFFGGYFIQNEQIISNMEKNIQNQNYILMNVQQTNSHTIHHVCLN